MKNKKLLSTVMAVCMAFSILPTVSLANEGADGIVDYAMLDDAAIADGDAVYDMEETADDGDIAEYSLGEESGDLYAASISWPATKNIKTYVISTKNDTVVYQTATSKTKYGTIYATDLITINGYSGSRLKVTYPVSGGTKTGYIEKSKVTSSSINVAKSKFTASKKITTYRRSGGGTELGYISKGDTVYTIATSGSYTQVIYPISGGYKMGWTKTSDLSSSSSSSSVGFSPRTTQPAKSNGYYFSSKNVFYASGYGMPNCTAYAYGRAYEILGSKPKLCTSDAGKWYSYNKTNKYYSYGSTPKLGAIACWSKSGAAGHVAVVEKISGNNVTISESHYYSKVMFDTKTMKKDSSDYLTSYTFLGYIYILN